MRQLATEATSCSQSSTTLGTQIRHNKQQPLELGTVVQKFQPFLTAPPLQSLSSFCPFFLYQSSASTLSLSLPPSLSLFFPLSLPHPFSTSPSTLNVTLPVETPSRSSCTAPHNVCQGWTYSTWVLLPSEPRLQRWRRHLPRLGHRGSEQWELHLPRSSLVLSHQKSQPEAIKIHTRQGLICERQYCWRGWENIYNNIMLQTRTVQACHF